MNQPLKVSLRAQNTNSSSMSFPQAAQERIETAQAPAATPVSPREKFQQHQAQLQGKAVAENQPIAPALQAPQHTESGHFANSRENDRSTEIADVFGKTKTRRTNLGPLATPLTSAEREAGMCSIWLPSNSYFYQFEALSVQTRIKGLHQAKFNKAHKESNIRYTVEAITSLLGDGINAMDLTLEDFYFVMYWIRLVSYTKSQYVHTAICSSKKHQEMIKDGKADAESVASTHFISNTDLTEEYFNPAKLESLTFPELDKVGVKLKPAVMRDVVAFSEEITQRFTRINPETHKLEFAPEYEEMSYLGDLASFIKSYQGDSNLTLGQKMTVVGDLDSEAIDEIRQFATAVSGYGVRERIKVLCPTCGEMIESEVSISAHAFL